MKGLHYFLVEPVAGIEIVGSYPQTHGSFL